MFTFLLLAGVALVAGSVLARYWDDIRTWLNTTAADAVEKALGLRARQTMFKAVSVADKAFRVLDGRRVATNLSTVFSKNTNNTYGKVTMLNHKLADDLGPAYLEEVNKSGNVMEMDYKQ